MQTTALLAGVENHRVGRVAGDDGLTKIVRTFHARFGSVKTGAGQTPRQRIAYVRREGKHAVDAADVEATAGDKEKVLDAADRLEAEARIRRGPTADRLLATQVIELPAESTPEQRAACAQAFVDDWRERGHPAIATVHVDGEERGQPHLHVEIAARPVHADGEVDRAVRLWRGKPTIYAERQKASDLVNRTCDPDPPYHPGGFRDIGREGDTPKKRIPAGSFRAARKGIREAREALALEQAEMIDGAARVVSEAKRAPLREAHEKRTAEIVKFKAAGEWPPLSQRARLEKRAETSRVASDVWYRRYKKSEAREVDRTAERDQERERGDTAEASAATLTDEKQQAEADAAGWKREFGDLNASRLAARDEAVRALTAAKNETATRTDEKRQAETRAEKAEGERDGLQGRVRELEAGQVEPLPLTERQRAMLVGVCARNRIEGDPVDDARVQLLAFAARHEEEDARKRRDDAARDKAEQEKIEEAVRLALKDERGRTQGHIDAAVQQAREGERQEQNRDGRGTGEAGGDDRRPDQGADRPGTEARRGGGAEDHGAGRAERPRAGGDRPEGDDGREQTGGVGQPASAGGPHAVDGNVGGDRGAASPAAREPVGVESHVVAAPGREDAEGLAREHGPVEEPGVVETPADRRGGGDGADVGGDGDGDWNWLLEMGGTAHAPEPGRPVVAAPPSDVVVSGGEEQQKAPEPPPPAPKPKPAARPWKDLSDDELVNHWGGASKRWRRAATDEQKADAQQKIDELHAEAKHRNTTLKALDARKQRRDDRGR